MPFLTQKDLPRRLDEKERKYDAQLKLYSMRPVSS